MTGGIANARGPGPRADGPPERVDGRSARRDRNRGAVLDAALTLFGEGRSMPSAALVAERSGVSLRSVYRYFEDREGLLEAAIARHGEKIMRLAQLPDPTGVPLDERIEAIATSRVALVEAVAPVAEAARLHAVASEALRRGVEERRAVLRAQVGAHFAEELRRLEPAEAATLLAALDLVLSIEGVLHLRRGMGLTPDQVTDVIRLTLGGLLG